MAGYDARWYDPTIAHFVQADSIVPGGVQGYDRYAYANNSPVVFSDPSGHFTCSNYPTDDDYCPGKSKPVTPKTISACGRDIESCGSVVDGQKHPTGSIPKLSTSAEETYTGSSSAGPVYYPPTSFGAMSDGDIAVYAGNGLQVLNDQLGAYAPSKVSTNVIVAADWVSTPSTFSVTGVHVLNYTDSIVRLNAITLTSTASSTQTSYYPLKQTGHIGNNPGIISYSIPDAAVFPRSDNVVVTVVVKSVNVPYPVPSRIWIFGNGLRPGVTQNPSFFYTVP